MSGVDQSDRQRKGGREDDHKSRRSQGGSYNGASHHSGDSRHRNQQESYDHRKAQEQEYYRQQLKQRQQQQQQQQTYKSGHMEVNSLYSGDTGPIKVNAMNAPDNSTLQCGCENIDCPFCNQMISISMSGGQ